MKKAFKILAKIAGALVVGFIGLIVLALIVSDSETQETPEPTIKVVAEFLTYPTPTIESPVEEAKAEPTPTQEPTNEPIIELSATPVPIEPVGYVTVTTNANLRAGPGMENEIIDGAAVGESLPVFARTEAGWLLVGSPDNKWIGTTLVKIDFALADIPVAGENDHIIVENHADRTSLALEEKATVEPTIAPSPTAEIDRWESYGLDVYEYTRRSTEQIAHTRRFVSAMSTTGDLLESSTEDEAIERVESLREEFHRDIPYPEINPELAELMNGVFDAALLEIDRSHNGSFFDILDTGSDIKAASALVMEWGQKVQREIHAGS